MCFNIITYDEYACGFRENTGRNNVRCRFTICRLSDNHRRDPHDCANECRGTRTEEYHLVMNTHRRVCYLCQEAGRTEHPGVRNRVGGPDFKYVIAPTP